MPRDDDWDVTEGLDPQGPSADDLDRFGGEMARCASCGREVYDQAEVCPVCGGPVTGPASGTPRWAIAAAVLLVVVIVLYWVL